MDDDDDAAAAGRPAPVDNNAASSATAKQQPPVIVTDDSADPPPTDAPESTEDFLKNTKKTLQAIDEGTVGGDDVENEATPDIYYVFEGDLCGLVSSFASTADLCTIDALSKRLQRTMVHTWKQRTMERFGMKNGKEGWKLGASLLKEPILLEMEDGGDLGYGGSVSRVATNGSCVAVVDGNDQIGLRDVSSLNFCKLLPSPIDDWEVAICGKVGSEVIVTSCLDRIAAHRGKDTQLISFNEMDRPNNSMGEGIPLLGCESHLIFLLGGYVELYVVNRAIVGDNAQAELLLPRHSLSAIGSETFDAGFPPGSISWGPDKSLFIFCYPQTSRISVWKLDMRTEQVLPAQSIDMSNGLPGGSNDFYASPRALALADDYVAATFEKKAYVWDRSKGKKLHVLCDVEDDERLNPQEQIFPLALSPHGHILVTSSHVGCAICVWNMKTGELLKRYNNAHDQGLVDMLDTLGGNDISSMVYLKALNAFVIMTSDEHNKMLVWAFPTSNRQKNIMQDTKACTKSVEESTTACSKKLQHSKRNDLEGSWLYLL